MTEDKYNWKGVIETVSGKPFDVMCPSSEMVDLDDIIHSLSLICRYNGHVPHFYSVAEHSVRASWYVLAHGGSQEEQLAALMHDAAEAYVGDMVRPIKRSGELGYIHGQLELGVQHVIGEKLGFSLPFPAIVHEADRSTYDWEVRWIRSGKVQGWSPADARDAFRSRLHYIQIDGGRAR